MGLSLCPMTVIMDSVGLDKEKADQANNLLALLTQKHNDDILLNNPLAVSLLSPESDYSGTLQKLMTQNNMTFDNTANSSFSTSVVQGESSIYKKEKTSSGQGLIKKLWTHEEDQLLTILVEKFGAKRWSLISNHMPGRIGKQCRERWHNHLSPDVEKSPWSVQEDTRIFELHAKLGNQVSLRLFAIWIKFYNTIYILEFI